MAACRGVDEEAPRPSHGKTGRRGVDCDRPVLDSHRRRERLLESRGWHRAKVAAPTHGHVENHRTPGSLYRLCAGHGELTDGVGGHAGRKRSSVDGDRRRVLPDLDHVSFEESERIERLASSLHDRSDGLETAHGQRPCVQRKERDPAQRRPLHDRAAHHDLTRFLVSGVDLLAPEILQLRELDHVQIIEGKRRVEVPGDDHLFADPGALSIGHGDDEDRIASRGQLFGKDPLRIVRPGQDIGQDLHRNGRKRFASPVLVVNHQRPDQRRSRGVPVQGKGEGLRPERRAVDELKFRRGRRRAVNRQISKRERDGVRFGEGAFQPNHGVKRLVHRYAPLIDRQLVGPGRRAHDDEK